MSLIQRIKEDQVAARKLRDNATATVLTVLIGECDRISKSPSDTEVIKVLKKVFEANAVSIENLPEGTRKSDLQAEQATLAYYIPVQLSATDIKRWIGETYRGDKNKGLMMKHLKQHHDGRYDGKVAAQVIDEIVKGA